MKTKNILTLALLAGLTLPAMSQTAEDKTGNGFIDREIEIGLDNNMTRGESTQSVSVITNDRVNRRSAKNVGTSILGQGNGLVSLDGAGTTFVANPTFYVRGLQTLNSNTKPLILVDGIERDITFVSADEVESVQILKDAAATALYGYKGANGAISITTRRGEYNSRSIRFNYDHVMNFQIDRPKFVDSYDYATAMNQALVADGQPERYSSDALKAFRDGSFPYQYPDVNWVDRTFRNKGIMNKYLAEMQGGGRKVRYFTLMNLISDNGFIGNSGENAGYSTQDKYVRGNLRVNLDIDLSPKTLLKVNLLGMLSEVSQPGKQADLWSMIYSVPSLAFPVKDETGAWGGNSIWPGTSNPVAQSTAAGYCKLHERALFADMTLRHRFSSGLGLSVRLGYDTYAALCEDHSKSYEYGMTTARYGQWVDGNPVLNERFTGGVRTEMSTGVANVGYQRRFVADAGLNYDRTFGGHRVYGQLKYNYEYANTTGTNTTVYRQNVGFLGHYAYRGRYIVDFSLSYQGSSRLASGTKWALSPVVSAAWVVSEENFLKDSSWLDLLKLRASYGIVNADYLPGMTNCDPSTGVWIYDRQCYSTPASEYYFVDPTSNQELIANAVRLGRLAAANPTHEKARKVNVGIDAVLFKDLSLELDYYNNRRYDIFVDGSNAYPALAGFAAPYSNAGIVDSYGFEAALDYARSFGDFTVGFGGSFNLNRNTVVEQGEEPQASANLITTGYPLNSVWGYVAEGFFQSQDEIDNSPKQTLGSVPRVGDVRYRDINGDGLIDANDRTKIGYSEIAPEIYYSFHLGAEWKGLGFDLMFQGTGNYSANLNSKGFFWGLIDNSNLSKYVYENSWTADNPNAKFPRLSSSSNANNYQTSTLWLRDRSYLKLRNAELYYNFPSALLAKTKAIKAIKLYARGTDLFTWDRIPEVDAASYGVGCPLTRGVIFGASITF